MHGRPWDKKIKLKMEVSITEQMQLQNVKILVQKYKVGKDL